MKKKKACAYGPGLLNRLIAHAQARPFTDRDIRSACDGEVRVILYNDLRRFKSVWDVLRPHGCAAILVSSNGPRDGHWVALTKEAPGVVGYMCPYGLGLHGALRFSRGKTAPGLSTEAHPFLDALLERSPGLDHVVVSKARLQRFAKGVNDCGRFVALRCVLKQMILPQFLDLFRSRVQANPDFVATLATLWV